MTSVDNSSVLPPPLYSSHEFPSPYPQCSTSDAPSMAVSEEGNNSGSPHCGNGSNKTPNSASAASLNHTSTPSPTYPAANSWPGFGGKNSRIDNLQGSSTEAIKSPASGMDSGQRRQQPKNGERVFVFTSKMANEAITFVQQNRYESIVAWHEANCRPSTSNVDGHYPPRPSSKRKSTDTIGPSPQNVSATSNVCASPGMPRPDSENGARPTTSEQITDASSSSSADLLMLNDEIEASADNPLRRMERMTQDSLFEPPAKVNRTASNETNQSARRSGEQDRNAKLEKMRNLEQQIIDKARWDRMVHDHESIKMAQGYPPTVMQGYPPQAMVGAPPPYQVQTPHSAQMHPGYRRSPFIGQIPPQGLPHVQSPSGPMLGSMPPANMAMSQPLRPSMNPPPYSMHVPQDGYMSYGGYPQPFPSQNYPPAMSPAVSPAYSPMYPSVNGAPLPPRGYAMYAQGMRGIYPSEKMMPPDMWNQQLPQPLSNLEARIPSQKIQYPPNGSVLDDNLNDNMNNMNSLFG